MGRFNSALIIGIVSIAPLFGGATLIITVGASSLSSDGLTLTVPISGVSGSLSPATGVTGFAVGDLQSGYGRSVSITAATASASTVTLTLGETLNNGTDDVITIDLSSGSNLTDGSGNTAQGQSGVALGANNSTWYAAGGSFLTFGRLHGGVNTFPILPQTMQCNSADCYVEFQAVATAIDVNVFQYNNHFVLQQDGIDIHDWGVSPGTTNQAPQGLVSGLVGIHTYRIIQINSVGVPYQDTAVRSIRVVGTGGSRPAARAVFGESGDSGVQLGGSAPPTDSRDGHFWQAVEPLGGAVEQHPGISGQQVCGAGGLATQASHLTNLGGTPPVVVIRGGGNDFFAGTPAATFGGCFATWLAAVQAISPAPGHIIALGIMTCCGSGQLDFSAYNSQIQTACAAATGPPSCTYIDPTLWLAYSAGKQADGIHLSWSSTHSDFTKGENVFGNRYLSFMAPYVLGSSYTLSGPSTGTTGAPSSNFTVTLQAAAVFTVDSDSVGRETITCGDGANGGTFTPSVGSPGTSSVAVTQTTGSTFTFTYSAASSGAKTITCSTAIPGWTAPAALTYTASGGSSSGGADFGGAVGIGGKVASN